MSNLDNMRGNPNLSKAIFQKVKKITESNGAEAVFNRPSTPKPTFDGGAFSSMEKRKSVNLTSTSKEFTDNTLKSIKEQKISNGNYFDSIYESIDLLKDTKEYSCVLRGLLTCYLAGNLDESVIAKITKEDKRELLGILREFEYSLRDL